MGGLLEGFSFGSKILVSFASLFGYKGYGYGYGFSVANSIDLANWSIL
jgi:hypothetical protein